MLAVAAAAPSVEKEGEKDQKMKKMFTFCSHKKYSQIT
jgi:hypothetical protein